MNINKKYQIFISSTYTDLISARAKVTETILSMYQFPIGMEMFSAGDDDQWTVIKRTIDISDYYVLIIGHRYGSITEEGISYTEKEFDYAREKGLPILAFIKDREAATKPSEREQIMELQNKLEEFVKKATRSRMCNFWSTEEELASKVSISLMKEFQVNPGIGWVRVSESNVDQYIDNEIKKKDHEQLELETNINNFLLDKKRQGLTDGTINSYKVELGVFEKYSIGKLITQVDTDHIKKFLKSREDNYRINTKSTMEKIRGVLRIFFEWLVEEKLINKNPVYKVKAYRIQESNIESLLDDEVKEIQNNCITLREHALINVLLSTGCKLGEIANINVKNIDWSNNTILITSANRRNRVVVLTEEANNSIKRYLDSRIDQTDHLFVSERKPYGVLSERGIQREISIIVGRTAISKKISPITFRHTFAKRMLENGTPMYVVQSLLGHKRYSSTSETYLKLTNDNIHKIVNSHGKLNMESYRDT
ncbi:tyrosine-type recombinase/integrase [Paenibacillus sp. LHD-38]|uniref:tyrosine-type recombinase/integrase n=1 Tax=Paenibacillus sp. LHD-38 TaxID=3072143 RepID=UPI00280D69E2|nr:tyrosine-type recombinase/integrase [Paenibacillus sp. LHD-38]MDQ8736186.1 tyrosine-type recombinase/integrase [Paenibacillus sp. LHD-38]